MLQRLSSHVTVTRDYPEEIDQLKQILQNCDYLSTGSQVLANDLTRLETNHSQHQSSFQSLITDYNPVARSVDQRSLALETMKAADDYIHESILSQKKFIDHRTLPSFDGTLLWKISKMREKIG